MEGWVKSILLCLGDEELFLPSPKHMHTQGFHWGGGRTYFVLFEMPNGSDPHGILCPKLFWMRQIIEKKLFIYALKALMQIVSRHLLFVFFFLLGSLSVCTENPSVCGFYSNKGDERLNIS